MDECFSRRSKGARSIRLTAESEELLKELVDGHCYNPGASRPGLRRNLERSIIEGIVEEALYALESFKEQHGRLPVGQPMCWVNFAFAARDGLPARAVRIQENEAIERLLKSIP
jgi:hypothetical protein